MVTKIYGNSDDLIEVEGDFNAEYGCYGTDDQEQGVLLIVSDGTILEIKYGKLGRGIWGLQLQRRGTHFEEIKYCTDENTPIYSDIAYFKEGITSVIACDEWRMMS